MVGLSGIEPLTSRLSGARSNHLSYRPTMIMVYTVRARFPNKLNSARVRGAPRSDLETLDGRRASRDPKIPRRRMAPIGASSSVT
jgi:hypothetical protein